MSDLENWSEVIEEGTKQMRIEEELWREKIGKPFYVYKLKDGSYLMAVLGFWQTEEGDVFTAQIGKRGPILSTVIVYKKEFIKMLVMTLEWR